MLVVLVVFIVLVYLRFTAGDPRCELQFPGNAEDGETDFAQDLLGQKEYVL